MSAFLLTFSHFALIWGDILTFTILSKIAKQIFKHFRALSC